MIRSIHEQVALYARVSTKDRRQDTENQLFALREYCARQKWSITSEYVDHETGGTSRRKHFQQMMTDASMRKFDALVVWALDREAASGCAGSHR
jgi:DNA invertase Pin-like site-specific DNA recombinase